MTVIYNKAELRDHPTVFTKLFCREISSKCQLALYTTDKNTRFMKAEDKMKRKHWRAGVDGDMKYSETHTGQLTECNFCDQKDQTFQPSVVPQINAGQENHSLSCS